MAGEESLLALWRSPAYLNGGFNDFGLPLAPLTEGGARELGIQQGGTLIVEVISSGEPIGSVSWRAVRYGPNPESVAWNIGIDLVPEARGKGHGAEAQRLLAHHLLATTPAHRVEAMTDIENVAEQRALDKAGFQREGVLRGAQFRAGAWHDLVVYAVVRGATPA